MDPAHAPLARSRGYAFEIDLNTAAGHVGGLARKLAASAGYWPRRRTQEHQRDHYHRDRWQIFTVTVRLASEQSFSREQTQEHRS
jgi:hypothetical protein